MGTYKALQAWKQTLWDNLILWETATQRNKTPNTSQNQNTRQMTRTAPWTLPPNPLQRNQWSPTQWPWAQLNRGTRTSGPRRNYNVAQAIAWDIREIFTTTYHGVTHRIAKRTNQRRQQVTSRYNNQYNNAPQPEEWDEPEQAQNNVLHEQWTTENNTGNAPSTQPLTAWNNETTQTWAWSETTIETWEWEWTQVPWEESTPPTPPDSPPTNTAKDPQTAQETTESEATDNQQETNQNNTNKKGEQREQKNNNNTLPSTREWVITRTKKALIDRRQTTTQSAKDKATEKIREKREKMTPAWIKKFTKTRIENEEKNKTEIPTESTTTSQDEETTPSQQVSKDDENTYKTDETTEKPEQKKILSIRDIKKITQIKETATKIKEATTKIKEVRSYITDLDKQKVTQAYTDIQQLITNTDAITIPWSMQNTRQTTKETLAKAQKYLKKAIHLYSPNNTMATNKTNETWHTPSEATVWAATVAETLASAKDTVALLDEVIATWQANKRKKIQGMNDTADKLSLSLSEIWENFKTTATNHTNTYEKFKQTIEDAKKFAEIIKNIEKNKITDEQLQTAMERLKTIESFIQKLTEKEKDLKEAITTMKEQEAAIEKGVKESKITQEIYKKEQQEYKKLLDKINNLEEQIKQLIEKYKDFLKETTAQDEEEAARNNLSFFETFDQEE